MIQIGIISFTDWKQESHNAHERAREKSVGVPDEENGEEENIIDA